MTLVLYAFPFAGAPPRSPSSLSRSNTPGDPSALFGARGPPGAHQRSASGPELAAPAGGEQITHPVQPAPAGALPVPRRPAARGWAAGGGSAGPESGSAGVFVGALSGPPSGPLSAAGSPAMSSLDRCVGASHYCVQEAAL